MESDAIKERFFGHLHKIQQPAAREFALFCVDNAPDYFWTLKASTSGRRHGKDETLLEHIVSCLDIGDAVIEQMESVWTAADNDCFKVALALHDCWRCGRPGAERRYPPDHEKAGQLRTCPTHPEAGYREIDRLYEQWLAKGCETVCGIPSILEAVRMHYGPWTHEKGRVFDLSAPFSSLVVQVHNVDYMQATMMRLLRDSK